MLTSVACAARLDHDGVRGSYCSSSCPQKPHRNPRSMLPPTQGKKKEPSSAVVPFTTGSQFRMRDTESVWDNLSPPKHTPLHIHAHTQAHTHTHTHTHARTHAHTHARTHIHLLISERKLTADQTMIISKPNLGNQCVFIGVTNRVWVIVISMSQADLKVAASSESLTQQEHCLRRAETLELSAQIKGSRTGSGWSPLRS